MDNTTLERELIDKLKMRINEECPVEFTIEFIKASCLLRIAESLERINNDGVINCAVQIYSSGE